MIFFLFSCVKHEKQRKKKQKNREESLADPVDDDVDGVSSIVILNPLAKERDGGRED